MTYPFPHEVFGINEMAGGFGVSPVAFGLMLAIISIWSLALKGFALWYSARSNQKIWFVVLLIANTFGILEIVYLVFFRKDRKEAKRRNDELPVAETSPAE